MILKTTIDKIFETARIEEVVGDFVVLKKRGANYMGLCPFHNEKTPSFTVSAVKGIYKCFGCGKGGNSVDFVMEHEHLTYPDALRYLAKRYHIEIEETEQSPEKLQEQNERESLLVVLSVAQKHFTENMLHTDEGKSIGYGYFKERGFSEAIIEKFQLGYSINKWDEFTDFALRSGHNADFLVKSGLSIASEKNTGKLFDRFSGRVMFPIHNITGRVIGFGGRTLTTDKKVAKYVNSPETLVYHKSEVLYGIFYARKSVIANDNCFLVEGYTDVISLHQAGIENVVASSGTSLTVEQIRVIKRYTNNVTILYDGDFAGIKASFRGIDLILEEGMNVKVLLFPDGEDPDSYSKKITTGELQDFIKANTKDFISFKTDLLYKEAEHDPIKKVQLIKEIVDSIALIPEAITRSVYIQECGRILKVEEQVLLNEVNKLRRKKTQDTFKRQEEPPPLSAPDNGFETIPPEIFSTEEKTEKQDDSFQARDLIRILICFGNKTIMVDGPDMDSKGNPEQIQVSVAEMIHAELISDQLGFEEPLFQLIYEHFTTQLEAGVVLHPEYFIQHEDASIRAFAAEIMSEKYALSQWDKRGIYVQTEGEHLLKMSTLKAVYSFKINRIAKLVRDKIEQLKNYEENEDYLILLDQIRQLEKFKSIYSEKLTRTILK